MRDSLVLALYYVQDRLTNSELTSLMLLLELLLFTLIIITIAILDFSIWGVHFSHLAFAD